MFSNVVWQNACKIASTLNKCVLLQSVHAIGRCAVALDSAAERCMNVLLELIKSKVNYVVQESIVVIKDIFRRYPNRRAHSTLDGKGALLLCQCSNKRQVQKR